MNHLDNQSMELEIKRVVSLVGKGLTDSKRGWEGSPAYDKILFYDLGADYLGMFTLKIHQAVYFDLYAFLHVHYVFIKFIQKRKTRMWLYVYVSIWTVAHQAPLFMGLSRQEYWSGLPFPSPWDLPHPGIKTSISYVSCTDRRVIYH